MNSVNTEDMIRKMQDSIEHEAENKANDIRKNAQSAANQIRTSQVYKAKIKIKEEKVLRKKHIIEQKSVQLSIVNAAQRMSVLKIRDESLQRAAAMAEKKLAAIAAAPEYRGLLRALCVQGLRLLREPAAELAVRAADQALIASLLPDIAAEYRSQTGADVSLSVSPYVVPDRCIGGAVLIAQGGRIQCSNTLYDRLHLARQDLYPQISEIFRQK